MADPLKKVIKRVQKSNAQLAKINLDDVPENEKQAVLNHIAQGQSLENYLCAGGGNQPPC